MFPLQDNKKPRYRFRLFVPSYPSFNIYTPIASTTTALGPVCVATAVSKMKGWDAEIVDENNSKAAPHTSDGKLDHDLLQEQRPADIIGLYGGLTSTIPRLYQIASIYKKKGVTVIAGGQHFIDENIDEALSSGIDYVVLGEGETTIQELFEALNGNGSLEDVKGIAYLKNGQVHKNERREPMTEFEHLPLPDFSLLRYAKMKLYPVERIRGCGMECEFCTVKGKPRPCSPERLLNQISCLVETRNARSFFIVDDLFGQQRGETLRFCQMLAEYQERIGIRLRFTAQIRLDKAKDTELLTLMRKANIKDVAIGFESPIKEELETMDKHIKPEEMVSLARIYHRFGFLVHGMFIFGYPSADNASPAIPLSERVKRYKKFIRKSKIDTIQMLLPVPLPGTDLRKRLVAQNRVYDKNVLGWEYYDGNFPLFQPDPPATAEQMQASIRKIMGGFYRFKSLFMVAFHIFSFPALVFFLHDLELGWKKWSRQWRNSLIRFAGWIVIKGWTADFKKNAFSTKLQEAKQKLPHTVLESSAPMELAIQEKA